MRAGASIQWFGTHSRFNVEHGYTYQRQFQSETRRLYDRSLTQVGFQHHSCPSNSDPDDIYGIAYTLVSDAVDDSCMCEARAGTVTIEPVCVFPVSSWLYSKQSNEIYWTVNSLNDEGDWLRSF